MDDNIKLFVATKAFVVYQGKVLILRESSKYADGSNAGKYDVVGGRVKPGQKFDESLQREVAEETALTIEIGKPFYVGEWRPIVNGSQWQIIGIFFECIAKSNIVVLSEDHNDYQWIDPRRFDEYPLIENLQNPFEEYIKNLN